MADRGLTLTADTVAQTVAPVSTDLTTLATAKARLGIVDSSQDSLLAALITAASGIIAAECRWVIGARTLAETFRYTKPAPYAWRLMLSQPVASVVSVTLDGVALTGAEYETESGMLRYLGTDGTPQPWSGWPVVVTYTSGYTLPANAPPVLAEVCLGLVARAYQANARDPLIRRESVEGVGMVDYFDRPGPALALDEADRACLAPWKVWVP